MHPEAPENRLANLWLILKPFCGKQNLLIMKFVEAGISHFGEFLHSLLKLNFYLI